MNVLAVDPGKATGFAVWVDGTFASYELPQYEFLTWAEQVVSSGWADLLVVERFRISRRTLDKTADAHWAMHAIGCLSYWATKHGVELVLQDPATAKQFATDPKLRALGWRSGGAGHADDAARHLLVALVDRKRIDLSALFPGV